MAVLPNDYSDGQELEAADLNMMLAERIGDMKPIDNGTRDYSDATADLGSSDKRYKNVYVSETVDAANVVAGVSFNVGNGKDGSKSVTADYASGVMGGEYWFDTFTIDDDITVDDSIGWLVIRANSIVVTKSGGATVSGVGKCPHAPSSYAYTIRYAVGDDTLYANMVGGDAIVYQSCVGHHAKKGFGIAGMAGTSGAGSTDGSGRTPSSPGCQIWGIYNDEYDYFTDAYPLRVWNGFVLGANGNPGNESTGHAGRDAINVPARYWGELLKNPINYSQSSTISGAGDDLNAMLGVRGSAGVAMFSKILTLTENLTIDTDGQDGISGGSHGTEIGGCGGSAGSGAASNALVYGEKSGTGVITQSSTGGVGGLGAATGSGGGSGGNGGDGADALSVEYDISTNTVTVGS